MKKHVRLYLDYFGYGSEDFIACEICGAKAVDIAHIEPRGMGGNPTGSRDVIENLMALCRSCHEKTEGVNKDDQRAIHNLKLNH